MQQNNPLSPWQIWSLEVQNKLNEHCERLDALEAKVNALCEQVKQLEARPTYHIDGIQYHFDQLKVEKLDGTLNIGMTAPGIGDDSIPGSIEQMTVSNTPAFPTTASPTPPQNGLYNDIYAGMTRYLDMEAQQKLLSYENELQIPLDPYHRQIIINDVRKQVPARIQYYMQKTDRGSDAQSAAIDNNAVTATVLSKTKRDADAALLAYMRELQNNSPSTGGMS